MAKPEWGSKRICPSCGARYYDLLREPIVCPKCDTPFDPETFLKSRRTRPAAVAEKELVPAASDGDIEPDAEPVDDAAPAADGEEEDEEVLEDASELGEDEDDMAEVIENVEDEER